MTNKVFLAETAVNKAAHAVPSAIEITLKKAVRSWIASDSRPLPPRSCCL